MNELVIIDELDMMQIYHVEGNEEDAEFDSDDEADFDVEEFELDPEEMDEFGSVGSAKVARTPHVQPPSPHCLNRPNLCKYEQTSLPSAKRLHIFQTIPSNGQCRSTY